MNSTPVQVENRPTLSFLATLAFILTFIVVRTFTTFNPEAVWVQGGIHFHHFWYGLAMIAAAGWLGIAWRSGARLDRIYAVVYGVGAGLIGDEIGLLLTLGDYQSELTYQFFIGAVSIVIILILLLRYGDRLKQDILALRKGERSTYLGIIIVGLSSVLFASGRLLPAVIVAVLGGALILSGWIRHRRHQPVVGKG